MQQRALSDPALLALYAIGGCSLGAMVALFNTIGFRLADPPFALGIGAASLVFLVYPLGTVSSTWFGDLADRHGHVFARGLVNYDVADVHRAMGRTTRDLSDAIGPAFERSLVHRDHRVLLP